MQRKVAPIMTAIILTLFLTWAGLLLIPSVVSSTPVYALSSSSMSTVIPSPTSTVSTPANPAQPVLGLDSAILAALIGIVAAVVGALIAGRFLIYQVRREDQRLTEQFQHEERMARLQKELEALYKEQEKQDQVRATKAEALRLRMLVAPDSERAKIYREALHSNPRIASLQILDMSHPIEVKDVYVPVHLDREARATYKLDPDILSAERKGDPNALLQASFKHLQHRVSSAIDPDEAIRTYKRCVFVGDPGSGKTTLLKYLTLKSADGKLAHLPHLPIYIELNAFAVSGYHNLLDFAAADWDERYGFPKAEAHVAMEEQLKAGNVLLLLDALDETQMGDTPEKAEASYQAAVTAITQLATAPLYRETPIVVTARKAAYQLRGKLTGFTELEVLDFRLQDMQQFVTSWFNSYTDPQKRANGNGLNTKLKDNLRFQALAANPLLLSLIVLVYEEHLDLPDRRAKLYKRCVDTLLTKWDANRNIPRYRGFKPDDHIEPLLPELAWHFHQQGRRYFPENEVLQLIADFLPKVHLSPQQNNKMLAEITNVGLLKEQARGWQGFLHPTLQEYFVAQYVNDHHQLDTLLVHRSDPWWEEVLLLYAGLTADASPLLRKLIERDENQKLAEADLIIAGRCLAAHPIVQEASLWDTIIDHLFETLTTTQSSLIRKSIAGSLVAIGSEEDNPKAQEVTERLQGLLANMQVSLDVRDEITRALG